MASSITESSIDKDFRNWLRGALAVLFTRDGLIDFVESEITVHQKDLLKDVSKLKRLRSGKTCSSCTTANVLVCPSPGFCGKGKKCNAHDPIISTSKPNRPCPLGLCTSLRDAIRNEHRFEVPSWKNTDARGWCTNAYQIAKCFMPPDGYSDQASFAETDFDGVITVLINNRRFEMKMSTDFSNKTNICEEARKSGREIRYSKTHRLSDKDLVSYNNVFIQLLSDPEYLVSDDKAKDAVEKLKQLKANTLKIHADDITRVLNDSIKATFDDHQNTLMKEIQEHFFVHKTDSIEAIDKIIQEFTDQDIVKIKAKTENEADEHISQNGQLKEDFNALTEMEKSELYTPTEKENEELNKPILKGKIELCARDREGKGEIDEHVEIGKNEFSAQTVLKKEQIDAHVEKGKNEHSVQTEEKKEEIDAHVEKEKNELSVPTVQKELEIDEHVEKEKNDLNLQTEEKKEEIDAHVEKEKNELSVQSEEKKVEIDANVEKQKKEHSLQTEEKKEAIDALVEKEKKKLSAQTKEKKEEVDTQIEKEKNELCVKTEVTQEDIDAHIEREKNEFSEVTEEKKEEIDAHVEKEKNELNLQTEEKKEEIDANVENEQNEISVQTEETKIEIDAQIEKEKNKFSVQTEEKKEDIDAHVEKEKNELSAPTEKKKEEIYIYLRTKSIPTVQKKVEIDVQVEKEKNDLNLQTEEKKEEIDAHVENRKNELSVQTEEKKEEIDANVEKQKNELSLQTEEKKEEIDAHVAKEKNELVVQIEEKNDVIYGQVEKEKNDFSAQTEDKQVIDPHIEKEKSELSVQTVEKKEEDSVAHAEKEKNELSAQTKEKKEEFDAQVEKEKNELSIKTVVTQEDIDAHVEREKNEFSVVTEMKKEENDAHVEKEKNELSVQTEEKKEEIDARVEKEKNELSVQTEEEKEEFDAHVEKEKNELSVQTEEKKEEDNDADPEKEKNELIVQTNEKIEEIDAPVEEQKNELSVQTQMKIEEIDAHVEKEKNELSAQTVVRKEEFDAHVEKENNEMSAQTEGKTEGIDEHIEKEKNELSAQTDEKKGENDANVENEKNELNAQTEEKKEETDTHIEKEKNELSGQTDEKKEETDAHVEKEKNELSAQTDEKKEEINPHIKKEKNKLSAQTDEKRKEIDPHIEKEKKELTARIEEQKEEIDAHIEKEKNELCAQTDEKKEEIDPHIEKEKKKHRAITEEKKEETDAQVEKEKNELNLQTEEKKEEIDANVENEQNEISVQTEETKIEIDAQIENGNNKFSVQTEEKKEDIDAHVEKEKNELSAHTEEKKEEIYIYLRTKKNELSEQTEEKNEDINVQVEKEKNVVSVQSVEIEEDIDALFEKVKNEEVVERKVNVHVRKRRKTLKSKVEMWENITKGRAKQRKEEKDVCDTQFLENSNSAAELNTGNIDDPLLKDFKEDIIIYYRENESVIPAAPLVDEHNVPIEELYVLPPMMAYKNPCFGQGTDTQEKPSISKLFASGKVRYRKIYVSANAGLGKTSLTQKLTMTWCQSHSPLGALIDNYDDEDLAAMKYFDLLFLLRLRDYQNKPQCNLDDLIMQMVSEKLSRNMLYNKEFVQRILHNKTCLIILDGLDEWAHPVDCARKPKVPHNNHPQSCTVFTTTRDWKIATIGLSPKDIDRRIEIFMLNTKSRNQLENNAFGILNQRNFNKHGKTIADFDKEVKTVHIGDIVYIPYILLQLMCLFFGGQPIGESKCAIYSNVTEFTLKRGLDKTDLPDIHEQLNDDTPVPNCMKDNETCYRFFNLLMKLGKLAFSSLFSEEKESSLIFDRRIVAQYMTEREIEFCLKVGLLCQTKDSSIIAENRYKVFFQHKSVQEFFSAIYITSDWRNESLKSTILKVCSSISSTLEMENLFVFVCGINPEVYTCISGELQKIVDQDRVTVRYRSDVDSVKVRRWSDKYEAHDLCYDKMKSYQSMQVQCMHESDRNGNQGGLIHLQDILFRVDYLRDFAEVSDLKTMINFNKGHVKSLLLSYSDRKAAFLQSLDTGVFTALETLRVEDCDKRPAWLVEILTELAHTLKCLTLSVPKKSCSLSDICIDELTRLTCLQSLHLAHLHMTHSNLKHLYENIFQITTLTQIKLQAIDCLEHVEHPRDCDLTLGINRLNHLKSVKLVEIKLSAATWQKLLLSVGDLPHRVTLKLHKCGGPSGFQWQTIANDIKSTPSLSLCQDLSIAVRKDYECASLMLKKQKYF